MQSIFGIPVTSIMIFLLAMFGLCMAFGGWIVWRHRIVFQIGVRNIPRRPAQTVLIVVGLMLSTLIITAAFATGDTLNHSIRSQVYDILGQVDEVVVLSATDNADAARPQPGVTIPETVGADLQDRLADDPNIEGILPVFSERVPVINPGTSLSEPVVSIVGLPSDGLEPFGGITDLDGNHIDLTALPENGVILGETPADNLKAEVGDTIVAYVANQPYELLVTAITADSLLSGYVDPGDPGGFTMPLDRAQAIFDRPGEVNYVAISNRGGVQDGANLSAAAVASIDQALDGTPYRAVAVKERSLDIAEETANMFLSLFVVFGLFSISVGILLIFLIFVMLAAERKSEMGMARAVGMKRRQLVQMFIAEGIAYDLLAALVGTLLGVGVAFLMVGVLARMVGEFLDIQPAVTWTSLVIAYTLGVIVTFVTIVVSSWRVSKLNIVQAIRDIPEPVRKRAGRRTLLLGVLGLLLSALMLWMGIAVGQYFLFALGVSLVPLSLAAVLRHLGTPARLVYTGAAAIVLAYWLLPESVTDRFLPEMSGDLEMFVLAGIMLVASSTTIIIWNADRLTGVVGIFGGRFSRWLPSLKTAIAYPLANKVRTGMTIAMFSLVVFSLVMMAAISTNLVSMLSGDNAGGGWDIQIVQSPNNPVPDLVQTLDENGMDTSAITATGMLHSVFETRTDVRIVGNDDWSTYAVNGVNADFIDHSQIPLQIRAQGYDSDEAVWSAIRDNEHLAIIDSWALPTGGAVTTGASALQLGDIQQSDSVMDPVDIEIRDPVSGNMQTVTIIGVMDGEVSTLLGIFIPDRTLDAIFTRPNASVHTVQLAPDADSRQIADEIEATLATYGAQATSIEEIVELSMASSRSSLTLFQGFMGLGLIVGIAALGVVAFRSVVERRQQIGMLRAIGYNRRMVAASFMIESSLITILGVVSGVLLGIALSWNLLSSDYFVGSGSSMSYIIPWPTIAIFVTLSLAASLLMSYIPSRGAARVPIAEALRYE